MQLLRLRTAINAHAYSEPQPGDAYEKRCLVPISSTCQYQRLCVLNSPCDDLKSFIL